MRPAGTPPRSPGVGVTAGRFRRHVIYTRSGACGAAGDHAAQVIAVADEREGFERSALEAFRRSFHIALEHDIPVDSAVNPFEEPSTRIRRVRPCGIAAPRIADAGGDRAGRSALQPRDDSPRSRVRAVATCSRTTCALARTLKGCFGPPSTGEELPRRTYLRDAADERLDEDVVLAAGRDCSRPPDGLQGRRQCSVPSAASRRAAERAWRWRDSGRAACAMLSADARSAIMPGRGHRWS